MAGRVLAVLLLFNSILSFAVPESKDSLATLTGRVVMDLAISNGSYMPPASGAVVRLYYHNGEAPDSLFSTTNSAGVFKIQDIVPQRIALIVSHMGFEDSSGMYEIAAGENAFFLTLKESPDTLSSAYVTAEVPLLRQIKDTTVYNTYIIPAMEDESLRRSNYTYISKGTKHKGQYSCNPILEWNSAEVYLYLYTQGLQINEAYKKGNSRAGCLVCPMSADKSDYMRHACYPERVDKYIEIVKKTSIKALETEADNQR